MAGPGSTVNILMPDGITTKQATLNSSNNYSTTSDFPQPSGNVSATVTDLIGQTSDSTIVSYVMPLPGAPSATVTEVTPGVFGTLVNVTGAVTLGNVIRVTFPDSTVVQSNVDINGGYNITSAAAQPAGNVSVTVTDWAGNVSAPTVIAYSPPSATLLLLRVDAQGNFYDPIHSNYVFTPNAITSINPGQPTILTGNNPFNDSSFISYLPNGGYISLNAPLSIADTDDYTIEFWYNALGKTQSQLFNTYIFGTDTGMVALKIDGKYFNYIYFVDIAQGNTYGLTLDNYLITGNNWHHFRIVKNGTIISLCVDGQPKWAPNISSGFGSFSLITIGCVDSSKNDSSMISFPGALAEFRITRGALPTTFPVPTAPFPLQ